jgi:hypothetical protein
MKVHTSTFPAIVAKDWVVAEVHFPDCWNGKDLDSTDHQSHVAFQSGGQCPSTHPVPIPQIQLEFGYKTSNYPTNGLCLSTGDHTGYSTYYFHII